MRKNSISRLLKAGSVSDNRNTWMKGHIGSGNTPYKRVTFMLEQNNRQWGIGARKRSTDITVYDLARKQYNNEHECC